MWICLKVKEGEYPPPPPNPAEQKNPLTRLRVRYSFTSTSGFRTATILLVFVMLMIAAVTYGTTSIFNLTNAASVEITMNKYGRALATTYFASLCMAFFFGCPTAPSLCMAIATLLNDTASHSLYGGFWPSPRIRFWLR